VAEDEAPLDPVADVRVQERIGETEQGGPSHFLELPTGSRRAPLPGPEMPTDLLQIVREFPGQDRLTPPQHFRRLREWEAMVLGEDNKIPGARREVHEGGLDTLLTL
jgi:hypothetical protein